MPWPASSSCMHPIARLPVAESPVWLGGRFAETCGRLSVCFSGTILLSVEHLGPNTLVCPGRRQAARVMSDYEPCSRGFVAPLAGHPFYGWSSPRSFLWAFGPLLCPFLFSPLPSYARGFGWDQVVARNVP